MPLMRRAWIALFVAVSAHADCPATGKLVVLAAPAGPQAMLLGFHNSDSVPLCVQMPPHDCVMSDARVTVSIPGVAINTRTAMACDKTGIAKIVTLAPAETTWVHLDLASPIPKGVHPAEVIYDTSANTSFRETPMWRGKASGTAIVAN